MSISNEKLWETFQSNIIVKEHTINKMEWKTYSLGQENNETIIFIPDSTNRAEVFFKYFLALEEKFQVVSFEYPDYHSVDVFIEDFNRILSMSGVEEYYLVSMNHSTIIGQKILEKYREQVNGILLVNPNTKLDSFSKKLVNTHTKQLKRLLNSHKTIFEFLFNWTRRKRIEKVFSQSKIESKDFWKDFYVALFNSTDRKSLSNLYQLLYDFWQKDSFTKRQFESYHGNVVICENESEKELKPEDKSSVTKLFKNFEHAYLSGNLGFTTIKNFDEIIELIRRNFLPQA